MNPTELNAQDWLKKYISKYFYDNKYVFMWHISLVPKIRTVTSL